MAYPAPKRMFKRSYYDKAITKVIVEFCFRITTVTTCESQDIKRSARFTDLKHSSFLSYDDMHTTASHQKKYKNKEKKTNMLQDVSFIIVLSHSTTRKSFIFQRDVFISAERHRGQLKPDRCR